MRERILECDYSACKLRRIGTVEMKLISEQLNASNTSLISKKDVVEGDGENKLLITGFKFKLRRLWIIFDRCIFLSNLHRKKVRTTKKLEIGSKWRRG